MAHLQANRIEHSDTQLLKTIEEVKKPTPASSSPQAAQVVQLHQAEEAFSKDLLKEKPVGLTILGFPWQFILVMVTIAIGAFGVLGKLMGLF